MKFKNIYRIESSRSQTWDYSKPGSYFITICTNGRRHFFGKVMDGRMELSDIGIIACREWFRTPKVRPDMNITMEIFSILPNHIHGIITIGENRFNGRDAMHCVSTTGHNMFAPQRKNLGSIIRGYKSIVTNQARRIDPHFGWQARYHDHVIRNPRSYHKIEAYIKDNVMNWERDRLNR